MKTILSITMLLLLFSCEITTLAPPVPPLSVTASIQRIDSTRYKVRVVASNDIQDEVDVCYFMMDDYPNNTPDPEPDDSFVMYASPQISAMYQKDFEQSITFSAPNAVGYVYTTIIQLLDGSSNVLYTVTVPITVQPI